ncbi:MAG: hypothetical protein ABIH11_05875, partial [Candidatus Altiarchaeota archaeon]
TIWMRYPNAIILPVYTILFIQNIRESRREYIIGSTLRIAMGATILIIPLLYYNNMVYGGYLNTGFEYPQYPREGLTTRSGLKSVSGSPNQLIKHTLMLPIIGTLAFPALAFAALGLLASIRKKEKGIFILITLATSIILFVFYGRLQTTGGAYSDLGPESSFIRYLLPMFALLGVFTVEGLNVVKARVGNAVGGLLFVGLVVGSVLATVFIPYGGLLYTYNQKVYYMSVRTSVLEKTSPDAVVFTGFWDKVIYPDRTTFIYWYPPEREENIRVIGELLKAGTPVYLLEDRDDMTQDEYILDNTVNRVIDGDIRLYEIMGVK